MLIPFRKSLCVLLAMLTPMWGTPARAVAEQATSPTPAVLEANPVKAVAVRLGADRHLRGVAKTKEGQPAAGAAVVLGVQGKPVTRVTADDQGRFEFGPLKPGKYQVATRDAAAMLQVYSLEEAPADAQATPEVSQDAMIARGQSPRSFLTNPWFIGLVIAAAIAIPLAIALDDDDDDDAS